MAIGNFEQSIVPSMRWRSLGTLLWVFAVSGQWAPPSPSYYYGPSPSPVQGASPPAPGDYVSCAEPAWRESGEAACEGRGLDRSECLKLGCCLYDEQMGECRSDVGTTPCGTRTYESCTHVCTRPPDTCDEYHCAVTHEGSEATDQND